MNDLLVRYHFIEHPDTGRSIIFLHGWRSDGTVWFPVMDSLRDWGVPLYGLDLPGFGKSEIPCTPFQLSNYRDIVLEFIRKLKTKPLCIVGHSFGGRIALKIAAQYPELFPTLILVNSAGKANRTLQNRGKIFLAKFLKPLFSPQYMQPIRKKIYSFIGAEDYLATPYLQSTFKNIIEEDLTHLLPQITQKTLIVWGDGDPETPLAFAHTLKNTIPRSELIVFPHSGHYSFLEHNEEFSLMLKYFVEHNGSLK